MLWPQGESLLCIPLCMREWHIEGGGNAYPSTVLTFVDTPRSRLELTISLRRRVVLFSCGYPERVAPRRGLHAQQPLHIYHTPLNLDKRRKGLLLNQCTERVVINQG